MNARGRLARFAQWFANVAQPRIARELREERPQMHAARQRVHCLRLMTELARLRRFPARQEPQQ